MMGKVSTCIRTGLMRIPFGLHERVEMVAGCTGQTAEKCTAALDTGRLSLEIRV